MERRQLTTAALGVGPGRQRTSSGLLTRPREGESARMRRLPSHLAVVANPWACWSMPLRSPGGERVSAPRRE
jgi:hypothetical protein